jgi:hypothetical protein
MSDRVPDAATAARLPLAARLIGIVFSPQRTMTSVVAHGQWKDVLALTALVGALCVAALLNTAVGRQAAVDQAVAARESWGETMTDQTYERLVRQVELARFISPMAILAGVPAVAAIVAAVLLMLCQAIFGGEAAYGQMLAVVAHAGVIGLVQQLIVTPLCYLRESISSPTNLSVLFPTLSDTGFMAAFLGTIDLFVVWAVFVLGVGLAVLYKRRTKPIVIGLLMAYATLGIAIGAVRAALTGDA